MRKQSCFIAVKAICICAALFITACSQDREFAELSNDSPPVKVNKREHKTRSIEEAKAIAADFFAQSVGNTREQNTIRRAQAEPTVQVLIKDSLPVRPGDKAPIDVLPDTLMYAISSVNGTIMIPADNDAPTIVGVFDTPNVSLPALLKKNNGLNPVYEVLKPAFNPDIFHRMTDEDWLKTLFFDILPNGDLSYLDEKEFYIAPKIDVEWNEISPFNNHCPMISGQHALAGSAAIAAGQAMTLTGVPASLANYPNEFAHIKLFKNINYQDSFPVIGDKVACLISRIGQAVNMKYGLDKSEVDSKNVVALFSQMGMRISTSKQLIKQTLKIFDKGFIFVSSWSSDEKEEHSFLIDGYKYINQKDSKTALLHVNFGMGLNANGYFLVNLFAPYFDPDRTVNSKGELLPTFPNKGKFYCVY